VARDGSCVSASVRSVSVESVGFRHKRMIHYHPVLRISERMQHPRETSS
jgi:hypothetical protein